MDYEPGFEREGVDDGYDARPRPTLDETLNALKQGETTGMTATIYYGLSDLVKGQLAQLEDVWVGLESEYRHKLVEQLNEISESNFELDYRTFALFALEDEDAAVRGAAVELLWSDETLEGMRRLMEVATQDDAAAVRAVALSALGRYILLGEYEDLPEAQTSMAVDLAFSVYRDEGEDVEVRRRALEALSHSSHVGVNDAIREAYESGDRSMKVSAVFAMGKTYDERWEPAVMRELNSADAEMRYEAVRAAGELSLEDAVPKLTRLIYESDREIRDVSIWALGEIGGREALRVLDRLASDPVFAEDEDLQEAVEDAMVSASMPGSDMLLFEYGSDEGDEELPGEDNDWTDEASDARPDDDDRTRWN
ncbi:MAG: HEAT repeat domain-containing protein [Chloroflexota bacterium]|nr:HEAT repeat domain-containing protein [Chloroflexota bacterium]